MKLSTLFMATSFILGLAATGARASALSPKKQAELISQIAIKSIAALKSSELAMEKSAASYLRDTAKKFNSDLSEELSHLLSPGSDEVNDQLDEFYKRAQEFQFSYEYNEAAPFDNEYIKHQLEESRSVLTALKHLGRSPDGAVKKAAANAREIYSRYHASLLHFQKNFLAIDEHRIRDFAHQIWESEGRPEGQAARHWAMAVELSKKLTAAELQLAFEQKRSAVDLLSTTQFDQSSLQETIH